MSLPRRKFTKAVRQLELGASPAEEALHRVSAE